MESALRLRLMLSGLLFALLGAPGCGGQADLVDDAADDAELRKSCGNGTCGGSESCTNCPTDCGACGGTTSSDTTPPSAPGSLSATATSASQINLAWSAANDNVGISNYLVYRGASLIATLGATARAHSDTGLAASTAYSYAVKARDAAGNISAASNSASATTLAATTTSAVYGPQTTISCPSGAVNVSPGVGANIQNAINANPTGTSFCLRAGSYTITASITPKSGDTFVGEYGAVLDGSGWTTSDATQAAFRAHNQDIDNVTIRNLIIRNMPQRGVWAYKDFSNSWTVEYTEIHGCTYGIHLAPSSVLRRSYIHHNIGNPTSLTVAERGGGYGGFQGNNAVIELNEIAYNGPEQKMTLVTGGVFRQNFVHHNYADGIWFDGENVSTLIENNLVEDNGRNGIFYEVSGSGIIRNNTVRRSGDTAVFVSSSQSVETYGNTLENNARGVIYFVDCVRVGLGSAAFKALYPSGYELQNNSTHNNLITVPATPSGSFANALILVQCSATQMATYVGGGRNLTFQSNAYFVPALATKYWNWGNSFKSFAEWQALGQDTTGSVTTR